MLSQASVAASHSLVFKNAGRVIQEIQLDQLTRLSHSEQVQVINPVDDAEHTYLAVPTATVFDTIFGTSWRRGDEILMTCLDGYQPSIPVKRFLEHTSWIAFNAADPNPFEVRSRSNGKSIQLGPYYLIWENKQDTLIRSEGEEGWPYQLIGFDLISFSDKFPKLAPPLGASPHAKEGFLVFRKYCLKCHSINGEGGNVGPELHAPVNVTEYFNEKWLKIWLKDPSLIRRNSKMPAPFLAVKDPKKVDRMIQQIITYLKSIPKLRLSQ